MQRRDFLLTGCQACAALLVIPAITSLEGCASTKGLAFTEEAGAVKMPLSSFAKQNAVVVNPKSLMNGLLVVKEPAGDYKALLMKCTHKGQPLALNGQAIGCDAHGSQFDLEGNVTKGPAKSALKSYPVTVEGDQLKIDLA